MPLNRGKAMDEILLEDSGELKGDKKSHNVSAKQIQRGEMERQEKALVARLDGHTYRDIGKAMGCSAATVYRWVNKALDNQRERLGETADRVRDMDLRRLDRLYRSAITDAKAGDAKAIEACLKVMTRRARLLGLDAPERAEVHTTFTSPVARMTDAELRDIIKRADAIVEHAPADDAAPGGDGE